MSINELKNDAEEFATLLAQAKRSRVIGCLTQAKAEVEREIVNLEIKAQIAAEKQQAGTSSTEPKRFFHELTDYGWDQSDKYVKIFITLNGVQSCKEDAVKLELSSNSMTVHVNDLNGKDYGLTINNLLDEINVEKSYRKIKTDMVAVYLKKSKEGQPQWEELTAIQKRLKQKQNSDLTKDKDDESPDAALVNIMKKMYQSGDSKTKQMIAKAWTESQDKARGKIGDEFANM